SPARTTWARRAGEPATRTAPSAMSFWILERERSEQAPARKRSSRVPAEGDPTSKRRRLTSSRRFGAIPSREHDQHRRREERGQQADELGRREDAGDHESADEVASPGLEDAAGDRVEEHVKPEDLAVERLAAIRPLEDQEDQERVGREVELGGVERHVQGRSDLIV